MKKKEVFNTEYSFMKNERIIESVKTLVDLLPDYFFNIPASSTGKYHPEFTLGEGGLIRHTKATVKIASELLNNKTVSNFTDDEKDLIICSLILHDGLKLGAIREKYTRVDHPLLASKFVKNNSNKTKLDEKEVDYICEAIESHMGEWNRDFNDLEVLPLPKNKQCRFVHMCDYLASRKFLNIKFDKNEII